MKLRILSVVGAIALALSCNAFAQRSVTPGNGLAIIGGQIVPQYGASQNTVMQGNDARVTGSEQTTRKGVANGYAPLDAQALLPAANLPAATGSTLGGVTVSTGLATSSGALSVLYGTGAGTAAAGNDSRVVGAAQTSNNLSDLPSLPVARANLGVDTPSKRPPTATDDSTAGYKIGDIWSYSGKIWQAIQVNTGAAAWTPVNVGQARPLDLVGTATGAYGTVLLSTAYTGSDLILTRGSDSTTKTIGFVGSVVDAATADAFCSANGDMAAATCYITTLYDQSGNANNATATAGLNAPLWTTNTVNGLRSITFNSVQAGPSTNARYMTVPTAPSFTPYNTSLFAIAQTRSSVTTGVFAVAGTGTTFFNAASADGGPGIAINTARRTTAPGQSGPAVTVMSQALGVGAFFQGEGVATGITTGQSNNPVTGAVLGSSTVNTFGPAEMDAVALALYNRALSGVDILNLRATGELIVKAAPQTQDVWVADGDSITNGYGATFLQGYPRQGLSLLSRAMTQYSVAVYGITLASQMTSFSAYYSPLYQPTARNFIVSMAICTNDIGGGTTGATCYANLKTYVGEIKALGPNVRVIVSTLLPRGGTYPTEETNFNNLVRAGWPTFADGLADFAADPTMGVAANSSNTAYYFDGLHPTDLGYSYLAPIMVKAVNALLR